MLERSPVHTRSARIAANHFISVSKAEDYKQFEASVIADYDAQSAVERELVLRLASLLWRLRRATTMETGLFEIQAEHLHSYRQTRHLLPHSQDMVPTIFRQADFGDHAPHIAAQGDNVPDGRIHSDRSAIEFARCLLRLANLPNFALDRLSRYEATLWRQTGQILYALEALDRRKPQERTRRFCGLERKHRSSANDPK
jgi:hypothetical protein